MKRALVTGIGGLRGAYDAGVLATLCRELSSEYFNAHYTCSVGVFASTFFIANQPDIIENTWRNHIDGKKLINFRNIFSDREILDLEYLINLFQTDISKLDLERVLTSPVSLTCVLTHFDSGNPIYHNPKRNNLFESMKASSALPPLHSPVEVGGVRFIDGGLSDPLPVNKALQEGCDDILVVYNKIHGFYTEMWFELLQRLMRLKYPPQIARLIRKYHEHLKQLEEELEHNPRIRIIRPSNKLPLKSVIDTDKERINHTLDIGIEDAKRFLDSL